MNPSALAAGVRHLRGLMALQGGREDSDEQLLHAFTSQHDDSAFATLVRRHGPLVLGVCRRVLHHAEDAEDAFQATFLLLARSASTLRNKNALGSWLIGAAYRVALTAKRTAARRRKYEGRATSRSPADPGEELSWREVRTLLDEEIARLPEIYRSVFILCCLESVSREEAARRLGLKEGTVSSRLTAARQRLSHRLARRGVELTALLAAVTLATPSVSALPAGLMANTMRTVSAASTSERLSGVVSPSVAELIESLASAALMSKAKMATVLLLAVSMLAGVSVWAYQGLTTSPPVLISTQSAETIAAKADEKPKSAKNIEIHGRVLASDGKPKAGAKLVLLFSEGKITPLGVSAEDGRFTVAVPKETTKHYDHWLIAQADGACFDFIDLFEFKNKKPIELHLVKDNVIRGRVVNTEGKPIRGVSVTVQRLSVCARNSLDSFLDTWKKQAPWGSEKQIWTEKPIPQFSTATDDDGRFAISGTGAERLVTVGLSGAGIADTQVWIANRDGFDPKPYNKAFLDSISKGHGNYRWFLLSGPNVTIVAEAEKVIRGVVTDAESGKGQPGVIVRLPRDSDELIHFPPEAKTDAEGRYEIHGIRKTKRYLLAVAGNTETGHMPSQVWAEDTVAHQPIRADVKVKKGVIVTGKIIDGATGEALPGFVMAVVLRGNSFAKDYPRFDEFHGLGQWNSSDRTDGDHAFRVVAIPGPMLLMGKTEGTDRAVYKATGHDARYPQYFTDDGDGYYGYDHMAPLQGIWNKVLEIKPGVAMVKQDIVLEREKILAEVQIQDAEGRPLAGAWANTDNSNCGVSFAPHGGRIESSTCSVYGNAVGKPLRIIFYQAERKLTGTLTLKGEENQPVIVKLGPAGAIKGRLLGSDGKPLAGMVVELRYRDRAAEKIHHAIQHYEGKGPILTDAGGAFAYDDVIPEMMFELSFHPNKRRSARETKSTWETTQVKSGECRDLGTIKPKRVPEKTDE
jgi:RNA polymerase sigma factor (sigma-70 family)